MADGQPANTAKPLARRLRSFRTRFSSVFGWREIAEFALIVLAFFFYFGVRGLTIERVAEAEANAMDLINLEKTLGFYWERDLQKLILPHDRLRELWNGVYLYGHGPVILVFAGVLYLLRRDTYLMMRNAFLISGGIGLIIYYLYPVAPPRLLPDAGFVDTILEEYEVRGVLMPDFLKNEYAAVPSLHFGWNLLVGYATWMAFRGFYARAVAVLIPLAMLIAIVVTGNRFIIDAILGTVVVVAGLLLAIALRRLAREKVTGETWRDSGLRWLLGA